MRAFITGSRGFVGRHLERHLVLSGDTVIGVDRGDADVTDPVAILAAIEAAQPEVIYHLAALTHVGESWADPVEYTRVNVLGTKYVLDAALRVAPEATVVVVSSADVYGIVDESDLPIDEDFRVAPANPYASSKVEAEHVARDAVRLTGQGVVIARPFNHIGPHQSARFVVPALAGRILRAAQEGEDSIAVGDLTTRRDFTDVRDVVRAYRLLSIYGSVGETYNVASNQEVVLEDIAARLASIVGTSVRLVTDPTLLRPVEVPVMRGSYQRLHNATGWEPSIALDRSLRDVVEELQQSEPSTGK